MHKLTGENYNLSKFKVDYLMHFDIVFVLKYKACDHQPPSPKTNKQTKNSKQQINEKQ